jgi:hypothetical protein
MRQMLSRIIEHGVYGTSVSLTTEVALKGRGVECYIMAFFTGYRQGNRPSKKWNALY